MQEIVRQVRRARRRLLVERLITLTGWCCLGGLTLALAGLGLSRLLPVPVPQWAWLVGGLTVGLLAALVGTIVTRPSGLDAAIELDHRCRLKERVSTAWSLTPAERDAAVGEAVVADATHRVAGVDLREAFPLRPRRSLLWPLLPAMLAVAVAMLFPPATPRPAVAQSGSAEQQQIRREVKVLRREIAQQRREAQRRELKELDKLFVKIETASADIEHAKLDRRQALAKLNKLSEQLRSERERIAAAEQLRRKLQQIERSKPGPARPVAEALQKDDLDQAQRELDKLAEQLEQQKLSEQERQQLAEQVEQMREQLERMAESQRRAIEQLERQCQQCRAAGQNAQADALEEQLERLQQSLNSADMADQLCQQLSQCKDCLSKGDCQGAAKSLRGLKEEMDRLANCAAARELLDEAERRLSRCRGGLCQGEKPCDGSGQGGLKAGTGPGGYVQDPTDPKGEFFDTGVRPNLQPGEMLAIGEADGPNRRGQVAEEVQRQVEQVERGETDPLAGRRLPRHLRDATREYFDDLRRGEQ